MFRFIALIFSALVMAYLPQRAQAVDEIITVPGMTTLGRNSSASFDVHGLGCKRITNKFSTNDDLFIPFASKEEWQSFLDYADTTGNIDVAPCPIAYSEWTYVGSCSAICGGGTILQTRSCVYKPTGQTLDCSYCGGECSQTTSCNTEACAAWNQNCSSPTWNTSNVPATCGQSCTVSCLREGIVVATSNCPSSGRPSDYISRDIADCGVCPAGSETTGSHTAQCSNGGLVGSGTIYVDDVRDCQGNIIVGRGTWTRVVDCCVPGLPSNQTELKHGIAVSGCDRLPANCTFNGQTVLHGQSVRAYKTATVPDGQSCQSQNRTCNDGTLSGSYTYDSCTVDPPVCTGTHYTYHPVACSKGNLTGSGKITVRVDTDCDGNNVAGSGYWTDVTGCCKPGALNTQTFSHDSSSFPGCDAPIANCTFNGQTVLHGASVTGYQTATVPFGSTCNSQSRTCNNGTLSGSYAYASCSVGPATSCTTPWGATVAHGNNVTAYQTSSVAYGSTCTSQSRTCNNGTLSGSYANKTCTVSPPANCFLNGQTILHGGTVRAYNTNLAQYPNQCGSGTVRTCTNGTLSGSGNYTSCNTVGEEYSCGFTSTVTCAAPRIMKQATGYEECQDQSPINPYLSLWCQ